MELNKQVIIELYPGIKIRKKMSLVEQQLTYFFHLDVQDLKIIDFQADFTGSQQIFIKGYASHQRVVLKTVQPKEVMPIAQIQLRQGWKLKTKFRFLRRPISKQNQLQYIMPQISSIQSQRKLIDMIFQNMEISLTPIQQINEILKKSKVSFLDSEFPPDQTSIVGKSDKNLIDDTVNHWRRPQKIFQGKQYHLFDRIHHKNLIRGKLSDNALYSVLATLSFVPKALKLGLIQRLFMGQKQLNPYGVYRMRFCKNGEWQTVIIDDFIPCEPLAGAKFISSKLNQIWVMLIEKAYAKLHKRYLSLHQLQVSNVFNDLVGCPTQIHQIQAKDVKNIILQSLKQQNIVVFYNVIEKQFEEDAFIPLRNYAYPISSYYIDDKKLVFKYLSHDHTEVEIDEDELSKVFQYICICKVRNWQQVRIKGKFVTIEAGQQAGNEIPISMSRWYYSLDLQQSSEVYVCLHQQDILIGNNNVYKDYLYCSLLLVEKSKKSILKPLIINPYSHNRQIQFNVKLQPGHYLVIPFVNSQVAVRRPEYDDPVPDIFKKLDLLMNRQLKYAQLIPFYKVIGQTFTIVEFNQLLKKYTKNRKGIGLNGFKQMYNDNKIQWKDLLKCFDLQRLFTLSIHSEIQINVLIKNNIGTQLNNRAHCQLILLKGQELHLQSKQDEKIATVKYLKSKSNIIQYMVQNKYDRKIEVQIDCTQSSGYNYIPKSGKTKFLLDSGQRQYVMKLLPMPKVQFKDLVRKQRIKVRIAQ